MSQTVATDATANLRAADRRVHPGSFIYQVNPARQPFIEAAAAAVKMAWTLSRQPSGMADSQKSMFWLAYSPSLLDCNMGNMYHVTDPDDPLAEARLVDEYWRRQGRPAREDRS